MSWRAARFSSWMVVAVLFAGAWLVLPATPPMALQQTPPEPGEEGAQETPPEPGEEPAPEVEPVPDAEAAPEAEPPEDAGDFIDTEVPYELRQLLEIPLEKRVSEIRARTNEEGIHNERGSYMKRFVKVDDDTYHVVLHHNVAGPDELTTHRYLVTLKRGSGGKWEIADEKLERTVSGLLFRSTPGDETFHEFDALSIAREGLTVTGGHGTMYVDYWRGRPSGISLVADGLKYDYEAPKDLHYYEVLRILKRPDKNRGDVVFEPDRLNILCQADECERFLAEQKGLRKIAVEGLKPELANRYREFQHDLREDRRENPMSGFRAEQWPDRRYYTMALKRDSAVDHWAWLSYDTLEPEEVSFSVTRLGDWPTYGFPLFTYYSEQTRASGADPSELERRPDAFGLSYDVTGVKGDVDMSVEDAATMRCDLEYRLRVKKPLVLLPMAIITLRDVPGSDSDAQRPSMAVHFIEDGKGQELTYVRVGASYGYIVLPAEAKPGDELTVHVKFTNSNAVYKLNASYSYVSRSGWMPFVRFGDLIDEFALNIRVPRRYEVLGVGQQVATRIEGDYRIAEYASESPVTFPTIIFGDYETEKPRFQAKKADGSEIAVAVHVDKTSMMQFSQWKSIEDVKSEVGSGISEIRANSLRSIAEQAANSLNLYREVFGIDYPFRKLDLVNDPIGPGFYGQAPASIVYLGVGVFRATGAMAHGGGTEISKFKESVVAHEVGHQWWGSAISSGNFRHYWFIESLAEYSSALFVENLYASTKSPEAGRKAYLEKVAEWRREVLEAGAMASVTDVDTMWSGGQYPGQARTAAIYNQGPYAFHILRETFGDEKFFAFLKNLAGGLKGQEVVTPDIQRVAEESFGGNMQWFFDQWIRGIGVPEYTFEYTTRMAEDRTHIVEGKIRQRVVVGLDKTVLEGKFYRGIITVTVIGTDKKEYPVRVRIEGEVTPFAFKVPVKPRDVILNKNGEMLAHDIAVNQAMR